VSQYNRDMLEQTPVRAPIRALFVDIDGTLVGAENRVSPGVQRAIRAARERDCEIILCTGRTRHTAQPIAELIGPPLGYVISSNGGVVMHLDTQEVLCRHLLPIPMALEVVRAIVTLGLEPYVYEDGTGPTIESARVLYHPDLPVGPWATRPRYRPHPAILEDLPFAPVSVSTFGPPEKIRPLVQQLRARLPADLSLIESGTADHWGMDVFTARVNKCRGLELIAERLGVSQAETMAIGDHINDLEMLTWAGIGVAMGNALPEVCAVADWVTASLEEDGVARAIERFILFPYMALTPNPSPGAAGEGRT